MKLTTTLMLALGLTALSACGIRRGGGDDLACMARAMYFESNRSSRAGMIAVGSVVMNRVKSDKFPNTVCGVVGQKNQFAPRILRRKMDPNQSDLVERAARDVLRGKRAPGIGNAMFFHTAGHRFRYENMHYVLTVGGNSFYEKRPSHLVTRPHAPPPSD